MAAFVMVQPDTWKAIGEYSGKMWAALGPLVGVLLGALLARSWSARQWERENRRDECRELLKEITRASTLLLDADNQQAREKAYDAYLQSLNLLYDRIFVAEDIEREELTDAWPYAVADYASGKITAQEFSDRVAVIQGKIVGLVVGRKPQGGSFSKNSSVRQSATSGRKD